MGANMKILKCLFVVVFCSTISSARDVCGNGLLLTKIRPGVAWTLPNDDDLSSLVWVSSQSKPTADEMGAARTACLSDQQTRAAAKDQAKRNIRNKKASLNDVIAALDLDK